MKQYCFFLSAVLSSICFAATPVPEGGVSVIPANAIATLREVSASRYGTLKRVKVENQPFTEAIRCEITSSPSKLWDIQFQFGTVRNIEKGEILWAHFYARTLSAKSESGEGRVYAIFEKTSPPNDKSLIVDLDFGHEWKEFCLPFKSRNACEAGKAGAGIQFGTQEQVVEIADFEVYKFGKEFDIRRLPRTKVTYVGQAANAPWRLAAEARIEKIRKGDLAITVTDAQGHLVPGAKVTLAMKRQAFGWGSAVNAKDILRQDADGDKYRSIIEKNFTRVAFECDLKWENWDNPATHEKISKASDWLLARNIEIRGHNLIWPSWKYTPKDLRTLKDNPEALRQRINSHIQNEVCAMKGLLVDWDVINEPYGNHDVMDVLGDN